MAETSQPKEVRTLRICFNVTKTHGYVLILVLVLSVVAFVSYEAGDSQGYVAGQKFQSNYDKTLVCWVINYLNMTHRVYQIDPYTTLSFDCNSTRWQVFTED